MLSDSRALVPEIVEEKSPNHTPPVLNQNFTTTPLYPAGSYFVFSNECYLKNELIYAGIRLLMDGVAGAPLRVYNQDEEEINDHPVRALIRRPNPFMGERMFKSMLVLSYFLAGNAFIEKVRDSNNQVVELWPLRPDRMRIIPSNTEFIAGYIYEIAGHQYQIDRQDIIHFKFPHPEQDYFGLSPLQPAMRRVAIDNESADFAKVTLQNLGVPPIIITSQNVQNPDDAQRYATLFSQKWGGRNRGKIGVMQAGMDVKIVGMDMEKLAFPELDAVSQKRVLVAIGVPPILLGQEATYANYSEARQSFYEDRVTPLQDGISEQLEVELLHEDFDSTQQTSMGFDRSKVPSLRPARQLVFTNALEAFKGGLITQNKAFAMIGEEPVPEGEIYMRPTSATIVPVAQAGDATVVATQPASVYVPEPGAPGAAPAPGAPKPAAAAPAKPVETKAPVKKNITRQAVLDRSKIADRYQPRVKDWARKEFAHQGRDVMRAVNRRYKALTPDQVAAITSELDGLQAEWAVRSSQDVTPILAGIVSDSGDEAATAELGVKFDLSNQDVIDFIKSYAFKFAQQISATSAKDVRDIMTEAEQQGWSLKELGDALFEKFDDWDSTRADLVARTETIRAANAGAIASYKQAGVTKKVWLADDDACPYCAGLDGTVVGIDDNFLDQDETYQPDGAEKPMTVDYDDVNGPPAHPNCRCAVSAQVD